jgi:macrolide-specific efflux system membrane fusion protein
MWERSEAESAVAEMKFRIAKLTEEAKIAQLDQMTIDVQRRQIKAPFDGLVEKVVKRPGAWVTPGEQVVRLVRMDKVRVEAYLDASKYSPEDVTGRDVTIEVKVPRRGQVQVKTVKGRVDFVSQVVDAGADIRIFAEVDNVKTEADTWLLRPGATADIIIH